MKLFHGSEKDNITELKPGLDMLVHMHSTDDVNEFGDYIYELEVPITAKNSIELPDLYRWLPLDLANALYAKGIISNDELQHVKDTHISSEEYREEEDLEDESDFYEHFEISSYNDILRLEQDLRKMGNGLDSEDKFILNVFKTNYDLQQYLTDLLYNKGYIAIRYNNEYDYRPVYSASGITYKGPQGTSYAILPKAINKAQIVSPLIKIDSSSKNKNVIIPEVERAYNKVQTSDPIYLEYTATPGYHPQFTRPQIAKARHQVRARAPKAK